ncbi:hypothetical protein OHR68_28530 [Spirillospora sp. NBC_00431]
MRRWHRRPALAAVLRRLAELVAAGARLRRPPLVLLLLLRWRCAPLVLLRRELLILRRELLVRRGELLVGRRELLVGLTVVGHRGLLLLLRRAPLVLLLRLLRRCAPLVLLRRELAAAMLRRLALLRLAVGRLRVMRLAVLIGRLLLGHGRRAPRVRLLLLLLLPPGVGRLPGGRAGRLGRALVLGGLVLGGLLLVRVGRLLVGLAALRSRRGAVLGLAALLRARRRVAGLLVAVPARALPLATAGAGQVGPAAHAEQVTRLERFVADRTFQGRHDTSPERTPARSRLDMR